MEMHAILKKLALPFVATVLLFCLHATAAVTLNAQGSPESMTITGTVVDSEGNVLPGATIRIEGTNQGTSTDGKGAYTLKVRPGQTLEVLYMGYETQTVKVTRNRTKYNFTLAEDENVLQEVVMIGYGSVKKEDLTGSVTNVKMSDIQSIPVLSVDNALQGRIAGADFMSTDGAPGSTTTVRIRGSRSITASNEPLYVVDGIIDAIHDLNDINADDIANISVLKDASSTAIYGSRGANGVIIITTKQGQGQKDKTNITFKSDIGISHLPKKLDIMDARELQIYRNEVVAFGGDSNATASGIESGLDVPLYLSRFKDPLSAGKGTDWIEEVTRTAVTQNYALSLSGRTNSSSRYASFSYNDTQGIIQGSGQQRFTGRINLDRQLFKWLKVGYNGSYTWRHNDELKANIGGSSWTNGAIYLSPLMKPGDAINDFYYSGSWINSPRVLIDLNTHYLVRHSMSHNFTAVVTPIKNLEIRSVASYYFYQRHTYQYQPGTLPTRIRGDEGGTAYRAEYDEHSLSSENTATYKVKAGKHSLDFMAGLSYYTFASNSFSLSGKGYMDDVVMWNNMNAVQDKETYSASTGFSAKEKFSVFGRFNWNYGSRYYLTATVRRDGASNFAPNNKYATFPSGAFKWSISNEPWMKNVGWIDDLSLRVSAGISGNDAISAYRSHAVLSTTTGGYLFDGKQPVATYRSRLDSPDLKWETTTAYNAALDFSAFKNRVSLTAEVYSSHTSDLLLNVQVAQTAGYSSKFVNIGKTSNKGIELTVETRNIVKKNFGWETSFTISHNDQMVDDIGGEEFVSAYDSWGNNKYMMYGYVAGYPLNSLWGFKYGGTWKNDDEKARNKVTNTYVGTSTSNGAARYYDINHDGVLSQADLVYQGNADPFIYGGMQNTFHYKNLRLGVYMAYSLGGKIYNFSEIYMAGSIFTNQYRYMLNAWHPERNPESDIPRVASKSDAALPSDFMVHDASYLRLKNVSLSYTLPFKKTAGIRDVTFSVIGENLYLWKNYNGFDPDVSSEGTSSTLRRVDLGAYPKARTITFSVQVRY